LRLRASNASSRLTPLAVAAGCVGPARRTWFAQRETLRARWTAALDREAAAADLADAGVAVRRDAGRKPLREWLRLPDVAMADLAEWLDPDLDLTGELVAELAEDAAYRPYLERQDSELRDLR